MIYGLRAFIDGAALARDRRFPANGHPMSR